MQKAHKTTEAFKTGTFSVIMYFIALFFYAVGMCTDYWGQMGIVHFGLWRYCDPTRCDFFEEAYSHDWMVMSRGLMVAAGFLHLTAVIIILTTMQTKWHELGQKKQRLLELIFNCIILIAGTLTLVTVYIAYRRIKHPSSVYLSWHASLFAGLFTWVIACSKLRHQFKYLLWSLKRFAVVTIPSMFGSCNVLN